jgi:hypothetical protein
MEGSAWKMRTDDLESEPMRNILNLESRKTGRGFTRDGDVKWREKK